MRWVAEVVGGSSAGQGQAAFLTFLAFLSATVTGLVSALLGRCCAARLANTQLIWLQNGMGTCLGTTRLRVGVPWCQIPPSERWLNAAYFLSSSFNCRERQETKWTWVGLGEQTLKIPDDFV